MGWPFAVKLLQSKFTVSNGATTRVSSTLHSTPSASLTFRLHLLIAVLSRLVMEQDKRPFAAVIFRRRSVPAFVLSVGLTITLAQYPMSTKADDTQRQQCQRAGFLLGLCDGRWQRCRRRW